MAVKGTLGARRAGRPGRTPRPRGEEDETDKKLGGGGGEDGTNDPGEGEWDERPAREAGRPRGRRQDRTNS